MTQEKLVVPNLSHRTHPLRMVQNKFEGLAPSIINCLYKIGALKGTELESVLREGKQPLPDDATLTGLQLAVGSAKQLASGGAGLEAFFKYLESGCMDGLDGQLARNLKMASPEGAIKDVVADRCGDLAMAKIISEYRKVYPDCPQKLGYNLMVAFQLSALTKAACTMNGTQTNEGGIGGMIERRRVLLTTLHDIGILNKLTNTWGMASIINNFPQLSLLRKIDNTTRTLIDKSWLKARDRADAIEQIHYEDESRGWWNNDDLHNSKSFAAGEAGKYVAIIMMNRKMGIDMLDRLRELNTNALFPAPEVLMSEYGYIKHLLEATNEFTDKVLNIACLN